MVNSIKKILVLCTGNSCRSQIAEGYLRHFSGKNAEIYSAGIEAHGVNNIAIKVMKEDGIDISKQTSNIIDEYKHINFDFVITVCDNAKENCPLFITIAKRFHNNFPDPANASGEEMTLAFITVRDLIKTYCQVIIAEQL